MAHARDRLEIAIIKGSERTTLNTGPLKSRKARILRHRPLVDLEITGRLVGGGLNGKPFMPKTDTRIEKLPLNEEALSAVDDTLKPRPLSEDLYADEPNVAFINNVRRRGIIELRFLQYVKPQTREWWASHADRGALLLGKHRIHRSQSSRH